MSEKWQPENPDPELFTTFERLEKCHRVEVTEANIHLIAKHFGWSVGYQDDEPKIWKGGTGGDIIKIGAWVDHRGSRWNPEPLTQGWSSVGTFAEVTR
jgi:hypothetical protein